MSSMVMAPFQLLELNVISAQDLTSASRSMRAYAVAWVHPDRKLSTRVDAHGRNNPTWNDKFVFRVDEEFLHNDTSAVMIEIYALHWFRDIHVGTVRVLVGNLIPPPTTKAYHHSNHVQLGMRFVALQVRRPSGRPQGILNIGVALLDSSMRSMPLCTQLSSAVGYRHLMGEEDFHSNNQTSNVSHNQPSFSFLLKPELRRSKSDSSSMVAPPEVVKTSNVKTKKTFSMISGTEPEPPYKIVNKYMPGSTGSSIYSGSDFIRKGNKSTDNVADNGHEVIRSPPPNKGITVKAGAPVNGSEVVDPPKKAIIEKPSSVVSGSDYSMEAEPPKKGSPITAKSSPTKPKKLTGLDYTSPYRPIESAVIGQPPKKGSPITANSSPTKPKKLTGLDYTSPYRPIEYDHEAQVKFKKYRGPLLTESELGPSPSEVAAVKAREMVMRRAQDEESSVMMAGWDMDSSIEGLQSKLERWRAELPPTYESSFPPSSDVVFGGGGGATAGRHIRRHTDGGGGPGLFSCFSNICGCECSIVCGGDPGSPPPRKSKRKGGSTRKGGRTSARLIRSPSLSSSFL